MADIQTKKLIFQLRANLDVKIVFGKRYAGKGLIWEREFHG